MVENTRSNDGSLSKHSTLETGTQLNLTSEGFTLMYTTTSTGMDTYAYDPDAKEVTEASRSVLSELRVDAEKSDNKGQRLRIFARAEKF